MAAGTSIRKWTRRSRRTTAALTGLTATHAAFVDQSRTAIRGQLTDEMQRVVHTAKDRMAAIMLDVAGMLTTAQAVGPEAVAAAQGEAERRLREGARLARVDVWKARRIHLAIRRVCKPRRAPVVRHGVQRAAIPRRRAPGARRRVASRDGPASDDPEHADDIGRSRGGCWT